MHNYLNKISLLVHLILATILLFILLHIEKNWFVVLDKDLQQYFILKLQFAPTHLKLIDMLRFLSCEGKRAVAFYLGLEYLFMVLIFTWFIRCHLLLTMQHPKPLFKKLGTGIILLQIVALAVDITENTYQINWLMNSDWDGNFTLYYWMVRVKWVIVIIGILHIIFTFFFDKSKYPKKLKSRV